MIVVVVVVVVVVVTCEFTSSTESRLSRWDMLLLSAEEATFLATHILFLEHFCVCALSKILPLISEPYMVMIAGCPRPRERERGWWWWLDIVPFDKLTTNETDATLSCPAHDEDTLLLSKVTQSSLVIL